MKHSLFRSALVSSVSLLVLNLLPAQSGDFTEDWDEFANYPVPEWFKDAKIGIYAHWGVYSVPTFMTEWYPHWMYYSEEESPRGLMEYHSEVYGDIREFGYKDFIPMFKGENFNPAEWAQLFKESGARFAGAIAEHHDGFSMWDSAVSRWNAMDMGPKRDVLGELFTAYRELGLKTVATFHTPRNIHGYFKRVEGLDTSDKAYHDLYGQYDDMDLAHRIWLAEIVEVIDKYQPDQIYYDGMLDKIPELTRMEMLRYYYDSALRWDKEVMVTYKGNDLPSGTAVIDVEKGKMDRLMARSWQTDDCFNTHSWDFMPGNFFKPRGEIIHDLVDIVSKNGVVLLNVGPKADGSIDLKTRKYLNVLGSWLEVNGEAIYNTRPWLVHGEGLNLYDGGRGFGESEQAAAKFTNQDFRFTCKDGNLYVICMGWPEDEFTLHSMKIEKASPGAMVSLLGHQGEVEHIVSEDGYLTIIVPDLQPNERPCGYAFTFKLENFDVGVSPHSTSDTITLTANEAQLEGIQFRVKTVYHRKVINNWGKPSSTVSWTTNIPDAGTYSIRAEVTAAEKETGVTLTTGDQEFDFTAPLTTDWYCSRLVDVGSATFAESGEVRIELSASDPKNWGQVNVWGIQLVKE